MINIDVYAQTKSDKHAIDIFIKQLNESNLNIPEIRNLNVFCSHEDKTYFYRMKDHKIECEDE